MPSQEVTNFEYRGNNEKPFIAAGKAENW